MTDLASFLVSFEEEPGYLDWARFGPLSASVRSELLADAELLATGRRAGIELVAEGEGRARELIGELTGRRADHVALQPSTGAGLMQVLFGLRGGILLSRREFPAFPIAVQRAADAFGVASPHWIDPEDGFVTVDAVREALTDDVVAVGVSLVDYQTGYLADLAGLREAIGDRLLIVDAVQGFGTVDVDYSAADVVCGNGYKWLRAGRGTGYSVFSDRALDRLAPVFSGAAGAAPEAAAHAGSPAPAAARSARGFTVGRDDELAVTRLAAALTEIRDAGVGAIAREVTDRADALLACADRYGIPVITPRDTARRAGIVTLEPAPSDAARLAAALTNSGLTVTARAGRLRLAAHAGTGADTIALLDDALAAYSSDQVW
ncbi:aminotransferase class V [Microbacterium mangrovi]|uniref:Aminotransferase class V n=1 Tax=Microbacterium mangrovi TaxID=1348253 RepID=A0A0B2AA75_9MICO|nr:aminotransferase class V-fold PLP-dependent enzyme [Microbacterium mangrovi]KHK98467.1 aminotransferase class V [Microbacterium mangrovi]